MSVLVTDIEDSFDSVISRIITEFHYVAQTDKHLTKFMFLSDEQQHKLITFVKILFTKSFSNSEELQKINSKIRKQLKLKYVPSKSMISTMYQLLVKYKIIREQPDKYKITVKKLGKSASGIISATVVTPAGKFSCPKDCAFCPSQPNEPKSYLSNSPANMRAKRMGYDAERQLTDRLNMLKNMGHKIDKVEIIIIGGTWSFHKDDMKEKFITKLYYAANIFGKIHKRDMKTLEEEKLINESSDCHVIGITIETRPDYINETEIKKLRRYGVTRVQLGIQHIDDGSIEYDINEYLGKDREFDMLYHRFKEHLNDEYLHNQELKRRKNRGVLNYVNRDCSTKQTINAIELLRKHYFKVDGHIMPDLPSSDPIHDLIMFYEIINSNKLHLDYCKIYPCNVIDYTEIKIWYDEGSYTPYGEMNNKYISSIINKNPEDNINYLLELLQYAVPRINYWTRINRIIRDFPVSKDEDTVGIKGGIKQTHMRSTLINHFKKNNIQCKEIRSREIYNEEITQEMVKNAIIIRRSYRTVNGDELFITIENPEKTKLYGLCRLRFNYDENYAFNCLKDTCGIRELHVYGRVVKVSDGSKKTQNRGFGTRLVKEAERIALENGFRKMAIISGVGVRGFYQKLGYSTNYLSGEYMTKELTCVSPPSAVASERLTLTTVEDHVPSQKTKAIAEGEETLQPNCYTLVKKRYAQPYLYSDDNTIFVILTIIMSIIVLFSIKI